MALSQFAARKGEEQKKKKTTTTMTVRRNVKLGRADDEQHVRIGSGLMHIYMYRSLCVCSGSSELRPRCK